MRGSLAVLGLLLLGAGTGVAEELRPFCPDRPGLGTPPCTIDARHVAVEIGVADWTRERDSITSTDTLLAGELLVRYGLGEHVEAQLGWTAYGRVRERDHATGMVRNKDQTGDVTVAVRDNLANPDGSGFSAALMPYASLPAGQTPVGAGDFGAGLLIPLSFALSDTLSLCATPEVDAAVDADGSGRHPAYSTVVGLGLALPQAISSTAELSAKRDDDPAGHTTEMLAALSFAWQPRDDLQFDIEAVAGLDHSSPDAELSVGIARRF